MSDWQYMLPYLMPIEHFIANDEVSEIMVNPGGAVFIERRGCLEATEARMSENSLEAAIRTIARVLGKDVDEYMPLLDARLPDGSRVAATWKPISVGGPSLTIRKFRSKHFSAEELMKCGMLTEWQMKVLHTAVIREQTILLSGGTGTGKTTLLNALAEFIPVNARVIVIEDTSELALQMPDLVRLEARPELPGMPAVTIQMLVKQSLRMRPSRLILGEVRGPEAWDLLQAWNTGHEGSLSTIHANNAIASLSRLRTCIAMAGMDLAPQAIAMAIAEAVQWLVHIKRLSDGTRIVKEVLRLDGYDAQSDQYVVTEMQEG